MFPNYYQQPQPQMMGGYQQQPQQQPQMQSVQTQPPPPSPTGMGPQVQSFGMPMANPYGQPQPQGMYSQPQPQMQQFDPSRGMFQPSIMQPAAQAFSQAPGSMMYSQPQPMQYQQQMPPQQPVYPSFAPPQPQMGMMGMMTQGHTQQPMHSMYGQPNPMGMYGPSYSMSQPVVQYQPQSAQTGIGATASSQGQTMYGPPTVISQESAAREARRLRTAMRGLGTDDSEVVNVLGSHNNGELAEISRQYWTIFGKKLSDALASDLSGKYRDLAQALVEPHGHFEAGVIYRSTHGASKDVEPLIEILCTRTPEELAAIRHAYANPIVFPGEKTKKPKALDMERDILDASSGKLQLLFRMLLTSPRSIEPANPSRASEDADNLIKAAKGLGTDEAVFFDILAHRSYSHLKLVSNEIMRKRGKSLEALIASEFSMAQKRALTYIMDCAVEGPSRAYARIIRHSVKGAGTKDAMLIRTVATRYDIDMPLIRRSYQGLFARDLVEDVQSDTSFNYKKLLTNLLFFRK